MNKYEYGRIYASKYEYLIDYFNENYKLGWKIFHFKEDKEYPNYYDVIFERELNG